MEDWDDYEEDLNNFERSASNNKPTNKTANQRGPNKIVYE